MYRRVLASAHHGGMLLIVGDEDHWSEYNVYDVLCELAINKGKTSCISVKSCSGGCIRLGNYQELASGRLTSDQLADLKRAYVSRGKAIIARGGFSDLGEVYTFFSDLMADHCEDIKVVCLQQPN